MFLGLITIFVLDLTHIYLAYKIGSMHCQRQKCLYLSRKHTHTDEIAMHSTTKSFENFKITSMALKIAKLYVILFDSFLSARLNAPYALGLPIHSKRVQIHKYGMIFAMSAA